jgi:hypothetical protein
VRFSQNEQLAAMIAVVLLKVIVLGSLTPTAFVIWKTWPAYYTSFAGPYPVN